MDVRDERRRLTAAWLNVVAAGVISAGAVGPVIAATARGAPELTSRLLALALGCAICGAGLHAVARALIVAAAATRTKDEHTPETPSCCEAAGTKPRSRDSIHNVSGPSSVDGRCPFEARTGWAGGAPQRDRCNAGLRATAAHRPVRRGP
jgi:hypothetical protein